MTNPFLPWLPMYAPYSLPDRPWWRVAGHRIVRADVKPLPLENTITSPDFLLAALDAYDTAHPMPVPPPMPGQVWWDRVYFPIGAVVRGQATVDTGAGLEPIETWPPPNAVLVAGPTPWGRDVPWAPAGWSAP